MRCRHEDKIPQKIRIKGNFLESVLIAVGFYIGVPLEYSGALPFIIVAVVTVLSMVVSEVKIV